jgi:hypothetical protein
MLHLHNLPPRLLTENDEAAEAIASRVRQRLFTLFPTIDENGIQVLALRGFNPQELFKPSMTSIQSAPLNWMDYTPVASLFLDAWKGSSWKHVTSCAGCFGTVVT